MKEQIKFLLYGAASIFFMAGLLALPKVKEFIDKNPVITMAIALAVAVYTNKIVEKVP